MAQQIGINSGPRFFAFCVPFCELLFIFRGAFASLGLLFFDLRHLRFQFQFGGLDTLLPSIGSNHQLKNLVLIGAYVLLGELDLMHQCPVLLVGFHFERLVAILRNLLLHVLDSGFVLSAVGFIGLDGDLGVFQNRFGSRQLLFNCRHPFG